MHVEPLHDRRDPRAPPARSLWGGRSGPAPACDEPPGAYSSVPPPEIQLIMPRSFLPTTSISLPAACRVSAL